MRRQNALPPRLGLFPGVALHGVSAASDGIYRILKLRARANELLGPILDLIILANVDARTIGLATVILVIGLLSRS